MKRPSCLSCILIPATIAGWLGLGVWAAFGAEPACGPVADIAVKLRDGYGEMPLALGASDMTPGSLMVVFANPDTGTWTIVVGTADLSCIADAGMGFRPFQSGDPA